MSASHRQRLGRAVLASGRQLWLNRDVENAAALGAHGIVCGHDEETLARCARNAGLAVIVSVHGEDELAPWRDAPAQPSAFLLGHVLPTASKPGHPELGWDGAAAIARTTTLPTIWLGGLLPGDEARVRELGGWGLAAIRGGFSRGQSAAALTARSA